MEFIKDPMAIEVRSFEIIKPYIEKLKFKRRRNKNLFSYYSRFWRCGLCTNHSYS